jgi:hypothetical protein
MLKKIPSFSCLNLIAQMASQGLAYIKDFSKSRFYKISCVSILVALWIYF